jgi:hypothetical protein
MNYMLNMILLKKELLTFLLWAGYLTSDLNSGGSGIY